MDQQAIANAAARILLDIEAVLFAEDKPFVLTSGKVSPVYIDCRKIISFPRARAALMDMAVEKLDQNCGFEKFDIIAGGETAGIPFSALIADRMHLPMQYVRKKPKGFGRNARIEGQVQEGKNALLVEDLTTDGGSKVSFVEALREAGQTVTDTFVIFEYGIFDACQENMQKLGINLHSLCTWHNVLAVAREQGYFKSKTLAEVEKFLADPTGWQEANAHLAES